MVMRHVTTCESCTRSLNNAVTSQRGVMALFVSCPLVEYDPFLNGPTGHKNHLESAKLHLAADTFKLVCEHCYSTEALWRDFIFRLSPWENYQSLLTSSTSMLNGVRPWTALENPRTEKPLISTSVPSLQHLEM